MTSLKEEILEATIELRSSLDATDFRDLIAAFLSDAPDKLETMSLSVNSRDKNEFKRCAHALKGSIGLFGLDELRMICVDLENSDLNAETEKKFQLLREQLNLVFAALQEIDRELEE